MIRSPWRFVSIGLGAAWLFDYFFWKKAPGISLLLWSFGLLLCGLLLARGERVRVPKRSYVLMLAVLLVAAVVFFRQEPFTKGFSFFLAFFLMLLLAATFGNGYWTHFRLFDYLSSWMTTLAATISRPFALFAPRQDDEVENQLSWKKAYKKFLSILLGLVLAAPVLLLLGALLASADPIFADWLEGWLHIFDVDRLAEYIFRFFYILIFAYLIIGMLLHAILPKSKREQPDPQSPLFKGFLGGTETGVILLSVNILFAVFLAVQFRYFFGGTTNISETGYTYSEYARRGFGELIAVSIISLLLYVLLGTVARKEKQSSIRLFTVLSSLLMGQVIVILVSAFQRLLLYEHAYGFTRLRTYSHVFMVWLAVLLAAAIVLEIFHRRGNFALALLVMTFGFGLTLGILNVDSTVVRLNVLRTDVQELDGEYIKSLSTDAVPAMIQSFYASEDAPVRDILGAELACRQVLLSNEERIPWVGFNWSRFNAKRMLSDIATELEAYPVSLRHDEWFVMVGNELQSCTAKPMDWVD